MFSIILISIGLLTAFPQFILADELPSEPEYSDYASWKASIGDSIMRSRGLMRTMEPFDIASGNAYVDVRLAEPSGEFGEGADPFGGYLYQRLTYGYPGSIWSSWIMYKVDGFAADKTEEGGSLGNPDSTYNASGVLTAIWNNYHGVKIKQTLTPVRLTSPPGSNEQIMFKASFTVADGTCHDAGCIVHYDTMLDTDDGAPISTSYGYSGVSEKFYAPSIPNIWRAYEGGYPPIPGNLQALGILVGFNAVMPDVFYYGRWPSTSGYGWNDGSWAEGVGFGGDSAVLVKWMQHTVCPGETLEYVTYYGIGELTSVTLSITHYAPVIYAGCHIIFPNPFEVDAVITNLGEDEANNVISWIEFEDPSILYISSGDSIQNLGTIADFGGFANADWRIGIRPGNSDTMTCYYIYTTCDELDTINVEEYCVEIPPYDSLHLEASVDDSIICSADCSRFRVLIGGGSWPYYYSWSPSLWLSDTAVGEPFVCPIVTGNDTTIRYRLIAYDTTQGAIDCVDTSYVNVTALRVPTGTVNNDTIWLGDTATLKITPNPSTGNSYEWDTWDTTQTIHVSPHNTEVYYAFITHGLCESEAIPGTVFVLADTVIPTGNLILPELNIYSACSLQQIIAVFNDDLGLDIETLILIINGDTIPWDSPYISWLGDSLEDTLVFNPPPGFYEDGDTIHLEINISDRFGNTLEVPVVSTFYIDFSPPVVWGETPPDLSTITEGSPSISIFVTDSGSGLDYTNLAFSLNGTTYRYGSEGIYYNPATGEARFEPAAYGVRFADGDTVYVCLTGIRDLTDYCGPNSIEDYCWEFYVVLSAPYAIIQEPYNSTISSCDDQGITVFIINEYDIDPSSIRLTVDGVTYDISASELTFSDSVLLFQPPAGFWLDGQVIEVNLDSADNIYGFHLSEAPVEWTYTIDLSPPALTGIEPPGGVVPDPTPTISMRLSDDISGIDEGTILLIVEGINYDIHAPAVFWDGESLAFDPILAGVVFLDGEEVEVCLHAEDDPDYCDPNALDTCWSFIVGIEGPFATVLEPFDSAITACNYQAIYVLIEDPDGVDASTIQLEVDGTIFTTISPRLTFRNDSLIYIPSAPWNNGQVVIVRLVSADDIYSSPLQNPQEWTFIVDIQPPIAFTPDPISIVVSDPTQPISISMLDSISGIEETSMILEVNGTGYSITSPGITATWDYSGVIPVLGITFDPSLAGVAFTHNETVSVCVSAEDMPDYCSPNDMEYCWEFYLDLLGPYSTLLTHIDGIVSACSLQGFVLGIWDTVLSHGIDTSSIVISVGSTDYTLGVDPELTWAGNNLFFIPTTPWSDGDIVECYLSEADDSLGNPLAHTDTFAFTMDLQPPVIFDINPEDGWVIEDIEPIIRFSLFDEISGVNYDGVIISIDGVWYDLSSPGFSRIDSVYYFDVSLSPTVVLEGGDTVEICVYADDTPDTCSPNELEYCWEFSISRGGPIAHVVEPLEALYSACDSQAVVIFLSDSNGIDPYTIELEVNGILYSFYDPELTFTETLLVYTPSPLFSSGSIHVNLLAAEDSLGNELETPLDWYFFMDLECPEIWDEFPPDDTTITTSSPLISIHLSDSISGLDESAILIEIDGEPFYIGDPSVYWDGETFSINTWEVPLSWEGGDMVEVCVHAQDTPDYCEPCTSHFCWRFFIASGGPIAHIDEPLDATVTACEEQPIVMLISDPNGVIESSIQITIDTLTYTTVDPELVYRNDTLYFFPGSGYWHDTDTIVVTLISATDSLGNELEGAPITWHFYTDFSPPSADGFMPLDGSEVFNWQEVIQVRLSDNFLGIDTASILLMVDGVYRASGTLSFRVGDPGISWDGLTLDLDPAMVDDAAMGVVYLPEESALTGTGVYFPEFATIEVSAFCVENAPDYCEPGTLSTPNSWSFTIPDDDTIPPVISNFAPDRVPTLTPFYIWCDITDPSGVWDDNLYLSWSNHLGDNGDIDLSFQTTEYRTDNMIPGQLDTTTIHFTVHCYDNDFDFLNEDDRTYADADSLVKILSGPTADPVIPLQDEITACEDQTIQIQLHDEDGIDTMSLLLLVEEDEYEIGDIELTFNPGTNVLTFTPVSVTFFNEEEINVSLVQAEDLLGNPMWDTLSWSFFVDLEAPACSLLFPRQGEMVVNLQTEIHLELDDNFSGVDASSIELTIEGDPFNTSSTGIYWNPTGTGGTLVFSAVDEDYWFTRGDTISIQVRVADSPDYCGPNENTCEWWFYTQPGVSCGIHPNPFTPNNDDVNDIIIFDYPEMFTKKANISIFNLRGIKVGDFTFEPIETFSQVLERSWNGKDNTGKPLPEGIYIYTVQVNNKVVCNGTLILAR
ncbi:gliding motility-associated C-terminal domain-containing protein [bacterium]|nr:gliding motility-associated C-terminal domain-containing protein [bacterium]